MVYRQTARSEQARTVSRDKLLAAARKLFIRDGYDATTMQDVVREAGTSIGNAYFYFGSKEKLLLEMIAGETAAVWDAIDVDAAQMPAGPGRIAAIIYRYRSEMTQRRRDLARLLATEQRLSTIRVMADIAISRWRPHLAASFPGLLPQQIELGATAIFGVNRYLIELARRGSDPPPVAVIEFSVRWNLRALGVPERDIGVALRKAAKLTKARS